MERIDYSMKNKKCFLFDLDGVITTTDVFHFEAWSKAAEKVGITLDKKYEEKLKGIARNESLEMILRDNNIEISNEKFNELLDFKNNYYISLLKNLNEEDAFPGVKQLLETIIEIGGKSIIVSASKNAPLILEKIKLLNLFDAIVDASEIKKSKPDPEIFIKGQTISGHPKKDCVIIEDSQAGIDGAVSAGIDAIAFEPEDNKLVKHTLKIESHFELVKILKGE